MSGIFGFWNLDGRPADPDLLVAMAGELAHRGPDGWHGWHQGSVAIGHRLFRTTPESANEAQPLVRAGGSRVLTVDVRLDNRADLLRRPEFRQAVPPGAPDAEVLAFGHDMWGPAAPTHLLGAFAYAAWNREERRLLLGRDHFGEKPLYYFHAPGRLFAFASEVKALWVLDGIPDDLNEVEIARHLRIPVGEDLGSTYYRAIRRVRPASVLTVTPERLDERAYWTLDATRTLPFTTDAECAEAVRDAFVEAVRCRLRTNGPVASMLSGGIDSSSITCVAAKLRAEQGLTEPVRTLSAVYPDVPASDERGYMNAVNSAFGTSPTFFEADRVSPVADLDRMARQADGAVWAGNLYLHHALFGRAAGAGVRVVLDGFDGDTTLSHGFGWLTELAAGGQWWRLLREVKAKAEMIGQPWASAYWAWIRAHGIGAARRRLGVPARPAASRVRSTEWARGLSPEFRRAVEPWIQEPAPPPRTEREYHRRLLMRPLMFQGLGWIEATAAGAGLEARFPYFDVRLIELCVAMPPQMKLRRGYSRYVMRQAMAGILPDSIRWRPDKANIEPGFYHALRTHAGSTIRATFADADDRVRRYLDPAACASLYDRFANGTLPEQDRFIIWRLSSLALWLMGSHGVLAPRGPVAIGGNVRQTLGAGSLSGGLS